jgi:hypothetical protein
MAKKHPRRHHSSHFSLFINPTFSTLYNNAVLEFEDGCKVRNISVFSRLYEQA